MKHFFTVTTLLCISITSLFAQTTDVVTNLNSPRDIVFNGNVLYIAEADKISKVDISVLSTNDISDNKVKLKVFPNPSSKFIQFSGLTKIEKYKIYNLMGSEIAEGTISNNTPMDIRDFTNGLYFLKFENGNTIKFIKE